MISDFTMIGSSNPFGVTNEPGFGSTTTLAFGSTSTPAFGTTNPAFGSTTAENLSNPSNRWEIEWIVSC